MIDIQIPYGVYWCSPFARWQGSLSNLHSIKFAAHVAKEALAARNISADVFDYGALGMTIPQSQSFMGFPWLAGMVGAMNIGGPTISEACATSARTIAIAMQAIQGGTAQCALAMTTDRTSNAPHVYYPNPNGPGGAGSHENWLLDNMIAGDPIAACDPAQTAENCAKRWKISTEQQHEVVLHRYEQYQEALKNDSAFHKRFMSLPFSVPDIQFRKILKTLEGDEGIYPTTKEKLKKLQPVKENGTLTYGGQTYPADGTAGMIITTAEKAAELATVPKIVIKLVAVGQARAEKGFMPHAPVLAAQRAMQIAQIGIGEITAIKSHNPFAVNDIVFAKETGADLMAMNNFGCSLIWGHPQGPTGMRAIIELVEELTLKGGGWGLFHGCAAGDMAMAVVIKVEDRS